ncbi:hypothetical protein R8Z50_25155 [Longispora sp. K20-0274]|uniref:hypothetical protein n=1 Tax=Longispora sp. K20-0274 TaxID=3088255 RepID=UPI00399BF6AB
MSETIALTRSAFVDLIEAVASPAGYGTWPTPEWDPVRGVWVLVWTNPAPGPHRPEPQPEWVRLVTRAVVDRAVTQLRLAETAGPADAQVAARAEDVQAAVRTARTDLDQFVVAFCGATPQWSLPWPAPGTFRWWPDSRLGRDELPAGDLLTAAAQFHAAAEELSGHPLAEGFADAADRLIQAGLSRLATARRPAPARVERLPGACSVA